jgi:hypothetical protein
MVQGLFACARVAALPAPAACPSLAASPRHSPSQPRRAPQPGQAPVADQPEATSARAQTAATATATTATATTATAPEATTPVAASTATSWTEDRCHRMAPPGAAARQEALFAPSAGTAAGRPEPTGPACPVAALPPVLAIPLGAVARLCPGLAADRACRTGPCRPADTKAWRNHGCRAWARAEPPEKPTETVAEWSAGPAASAQESAGRLEGPHKAVARNRWPGQEPTSPAERRQLPGQGAQRLATHRYP